MDTLEEATFEVFEADNGKEALLQLMYQDIDVIVSDVQMDVMDGNQLLTAVREKYPSIPFVMMTAHASVERAVAAARLPRRLLLVGELLERAGEPPAHLCPRSIRKAEGGSLLQQRPRAARLARQEP